METKFTKGDWKVNTQQKWPFHTYIETEDMGIATIQMAHYSTSDNTIEDCLKRDTRNSEVLANAKLIASAPKLYEALQEIFTAYQGELKRGIITKDTELVIKDKVSIKAIAALKAVTE